MKKVIVCLMCVLPFVASAQESVSTETRKPYWTSASELIFSWGDVEDEPMDISSVMRFSMFFHFQEQLHIDMNDHFGVFVGFGVRNIGFINELSDSVKLKQRSYSFGIPLALKIGNFPDNMYVAIGGEAELMFHYKQKAFYDDSKYKKSAWFSDRTNMINPSLFLDINFTKGAYVRFKYYLLDFLQEENQSVKVDGVNIPYSPEKSKLFYVALGMNIPHKKLKKQISDPAVPFSSR